EAERGCGFALLARDRLDGAARRLRNLRAPPEDQCDRRGVERREGELRRHRRESEVRGEDRHEDRQAAEDLDVQPEERPQRTKAGRQQRAEPDADNGASRDGEHRNPQRVRQPLVEDVVPNRPYPGGHQRASGNASRRSSRRTPPEMLQTSVRYTIPSSVRASAVSSVRLLMLIAVVVSSG